MEKKLARLMYNIDEFKRNWAEIIECYNNIEETDDDFVSAFSIHYPFEKSMEDYTLEIINWASSLEEYQKKKEKEVITKSVINDMRNLYYDPWRDDPTDEEIIKEIKENPIELVYELFEMLKEKEVG